MALQPRISTKKKAVAEMQVAQARKVPVKARVDAMLRVVSLRDKGRAVRRKTRVWPLRGSGECFRGALLPPGALAERLVNFKVKKERQRLEPLHHLVRRLLDPTRWDSLLVSGTARSPAEVKAKAYSSQGEQ